MMWNLQSYPTTVLNERMWHFRGQNILWPLLQDPQHPGYTHLAIYVGALRLRDAGSYVCAAVIPLIPTTYTAKNQSGSRCHGTLHRGASSTIQTAELLFIRRKSPAFVWATSGSAAADVLMTSVTVMWSETVGLSTRPVWGKRNRSWSCSWSCTLWYWSCRSGVVLWDTVLSRSSS